MRIKSLVYSIFLLLVLGCEKNDNNFNPDYDKTYLEGTIPLPSDMRPYLIGIYSSESSTAGLGYRFVMKWNQNKLTLFSNRNGNYAVMDVGINLSDSSIKMAGYWRSPMNNEEGKLYLTITKQNGADDIISKKFT